MRLIGYGRKKSRARVVHHALRGAFSPRKARFRRPPTGPRLVSVGTAHPPQKYSQHDILRLFGETDPKIRELFRCGHIKSRYLYLPQPIDGSLPDETNKEMLDRHLRGAMEIGPQAIDACLHPLGLGPQDIDFLCCVSSTGFLCPGLSAHLIKQMDFRQDVRRSDILGMGCNAGINGLQAVTHFAQSAPGRVGLLLCVEICSAAYVYNRTMATAVVNSLFGDGAGAILVRQDDFDCWQRGPAVVDFESHTIPTAIDAMRYDLEGTKLSFYLSREIPYDIGDHVEQPVHRLLKRHGLARRDIDHWIVHSGGKKVIDAIEYNLGLSNYDLRHTLAVLKNYGNLSSGSIFFSYERLCREGVVREGDLGVAIAMGPGTTIETALLAW